MMNLFLTGDIRVGKSTIINRALEELRLNPSGFRTCRYFLEGQLSGFIMEDLTGTVPADKKPLYIAMPGSQGTWEAKVDTFETFGVRILQASLASPKDLILMDELGHLEAGALRFQEQVFQCLSAPVPVLGVIKSRSTSFLDKLRRRDDVTIITVTKENRNKEYENIKVCLQANFT